MATAAKMLRGEGPHHQIVITGRSARAKSFARAFPVGQEAERIKSLMIKPSARTCRKAGIFFELLQELSELEASPVERLS